MLDLKASYRLVKVPDELHFDYNHKIQVNPRKLQQILSTVFNIRMKPSDVDVLLDQRQLLIHQITAAYPSDKICSRQKETLPKSLVLSAIFGRNSACLSANDQHLAINANPRASWKFDLFTMMDMQARNVVFSLINNQLTTKFQGRV